MPRFRMTAMAFALVLVAAFVAGEAWRPKISPPIRNGGVLDVTLASSLEAFDDCTEFLDTVKTQAEPQISPWGLGGGTDDFRGGRGNVLETVADSAGTTSGSTGSASAGGDSDGAAAPPLAQEAEKSANGIVEVSGTNVQEQGVDEPDIVKSDGKVLAAIARGRLQLIDLTGAQPALVHDADLPNGWNQQLLLHNSRLLITSTVQEQPEAPHPAASGKLAESSLMIYNPSPPKVQLTLMDVSDPANPRTIGSVRVDGDLVSSRLVDNMARVVTRSYTQPAFSQPQMMEETTQKDYEEIQRQGLAVNQKILRESTAADWLPSYEVRTAADDTVASEPLVECSDVRHPAQIRGFGMVSVMAFDLMSNNEGSLAPTGTASVMSDGDTVYATPDRLFVAINRWEEFATPGDPRVGIPEPLIDPPADTPVEAPAVQDNDATVQSDVRAVPEPAIEPGIEPGIAPDIGVVDPAPGIGIAPAPPRTFVDIHEFDTTNPAQPVYASSGAVPGQLLNQWALSWHNGHLRVATTEDDFRSQSESAVRVLRRTGNRMREVGKAGGLGKGERIYAVRYFGDTAFVVTFRQTDPLYSLDLSDPAAPRVLGELKIPGYSAYLHPVGDGLLLGVGQDADEATGQRKGVQVSLFDVSDLTAPRRVSNLTFEPDSSTEVEHEHRAFLWWPALRRAILPYQRAHWNDSIQRDDGFFGALALDINGDVREAGRLSHTQAQQFDPWFSQIRRAVMVGDTLYTMSDQGLMASGAQDLQLRSWLDFRGPSPSDQQVRGGFEGGAPVVID